MTKNSINMDVYLELILGVRRIGGKKAQHVCQTTRGNRFHGLVLVRQNRARDEVLADDIQRRRVNRLLV